MVPSRWVKGKPHPSVCRPTPVAVSDRHDRTSDREEYSRLAAIFWQEVPITRREVLVLLAHPALHRSRVNRVLRDAVPDGVRVHDLYEAYPEFDVDVPREQALLEDHDVVVLQHPFYWYSTPALVKQWLDLVLEHGWAYGSGGVALAGKWMLSALTAGGRESSYRPDGTNRYTIRQLLAPLEQTAKLCGMEWLPPFVVHGTHLLDAAGIRRSADDYRRVLTALRDGDLQPDAVRGLERINDVLDTAREG